MFGDRRVRIDYLFVQFDDTVCQVRVPARLKLELEEFLGESVIVKVQWVLISVIGHCNRPQM